MAGSKAVEKIKQMGNSGKKMSALEIAALGKSLASGGQSTALEMDAEDQDWNVTVSRAKSGGPGSWFASKVDFTLNGSQFLGKVGYSVEGGIVPLFDGAALDLQGADLQSVNPKKAVPDSKLGNPSAYKNWIIGKGGLLVLAPVGADNVVPMPVEDMVITEKGLTAKSEKPVDFTMGQTEVHGESLDFCADIGVLYGVKVREHGVEQPGKYREEAAVSGDGIRIFLDPDYTEQTMPDRETSKANTFLEETTKLVQELAPEETIKFGFAKDTEEENVGLGIEADLQKGNFHLGYNPNPIENREAPLWEQLAVASKQEIKKVLLDAVKNRISTGEWAGAKGIFEEKWEQIKEVYDGFTAEELQENWKILPNQLKDFFRGKLTDEKEIKEYMEKLVPAGPIKDFLGMKDNEETEGKKEEDGSSKITLLKIPLFPPLLSFGVVLMPEYRFSPYIRAGVDNLYQLWGAGEETSTNLEFKAGVTASLSLRAAAELDLSALIVSGFGSLWAQAALMGGGVKPLKGVSLGKDVNGRSDTALEVRASLPIMKQSDGSIRQTGDLNAEILGGFQLKGSVGANVGVRSSVLMWEKTLWEKEFASWNLLAMALNLSVSKSPTDSMFSGWNLNEASIRIAGPGDGIGAAFLEKNTADRRYGLYEPEAVESKNYQDIETNFLTALKLLKDYAGQGETSNSTLVIPEKEENSGLAGTLEQMTELQNQFVHIWVNAQNELEKMEEYLETLESSGAEGRHIEKARRAVELHGGRIAHMEKWSEESGTDILEHYIKHSSNGGSGYLHFLEEQAKEEATGYEALVDYERQRYKEKTKKHEERIVVLMTMLEEGKSDEEIRSAYQKKGGKEVFKNLSLFENTDSLLRYEEEKLLKTTSSSSKRKGKMLSLSAQEKNDASFFVKYAEKLSQNDLLNYGDRDMLLEYEEKAFKNKKNADIADYYETEGQKKAAEVLGSDGRMLNQFRNKKKKKGDTSIPMLSAIFGKEFYRTASADDLLDLELSLIRGEEGRILSDYLTNQSSQNSQIPAGTQNSQNPRGEDKLSLVFGKQKNQAMTRFSAYLNQSEIGDLIPCLTIEGLLEYAREAQKKKKTPEGREQSAKEIQYLYRGLAKIEATSPDKQREAEEEYIAGYFERFGRAEDDYRAALESGETVNLPLMLQGFSDGSDNQRYMMLQQAKAQGLYDFKVLETYLNMGGKKDEIKEHQIEKESRGVQDISDISRYYESRLNEQTNHFERYKTLKDLYDSGMSYEEMLNRYKELGGGKGFGVSIRDEMKKGTLKGQPLTREQIVLFEEERLERKGKKHRDRLELITSKKEEGIAYEEILKSYQEYARKDGTGFKAASKQKMEEMKLARFSTGFEKSLKKKKNSLTGENLLLYERKKKEEIGKSHADRLRFLLGLAPGASDFLNAPLVSDKEKREEIRQEYLNKSKRFKKGNLVKKMASLRTNELLNRPDEEMKESILSYEKGRKEFYQARMQELMDRRREVENMRKDLSQTTQLCHIITNNLKDMKKHPANIFARITEFEQAAHFITDQKQSVVEMQQKKDDVIARAGDAAKRIKEVEKMAREEER